MASVKSVVTIEVDNQPLGIADPITRRLEVEQLSLQDVLKLAPETVPPSLYPTAFLPSTVPVRKVWLLRSDHKVNIYANGDNGPELAFQLNPGGFVLMVDGALGDLLIENPDLAQFAKVEQLVAGGLLT